MTKAHFDALSIGSAFAWDGDILSAQRSDETALGYHINGLPSHLTADLGPTHRLGRWAFYIDSGTQLLHPENSYGSKEEAFAALKEWLSKHAWGTSLVCMDQLRIRPRPT